MAYYDNKIDDALKFLQSPQLTNPMGDKPIAYVAYDPADAIDIDKAIVDVVKPKADFWGYKNIKVLKMGSVIDEAIKNSKNYRLFTNPRFKERMVFEGVRSDILNSKCMSKAILATQDEMKEKDHPLIIITELEMLHPFERMGNFENDHYNDIIVPMLILYPGINKGIARSFLGVNDIDGNYRSKNF